MKNLLILFFLHITFSLFSQNIKLNDTTVNIEDLILKQKVKVCRYHSQSYDTLNLFKKQMGVSMKVYRHYLHASDKKSISYPSWKESSQDTILFNPRGPRQYFFHNRNRKLTWSAKTFYEGVEIAGEKNIL